MNTLLLASDPMDSVRTESQISARAVPAAPFRVAPDAAARKLALLRRMGMFGSDLKGTSISRATTGVELKEAYSLVHDVYVGTGYLKPEPAGLRLRLFETLSTTATFVAKQNGRVVGVLSVVGDSDDHGLPSDEAFHPELNALRAQKLRLCELTNQAVADDYRKSAVPTDLMRCAVAHAIHAGNDEAVASVSPSHNGFYDLMGFRQVGSERSYSQKLHDPVVALSMDLNHYRDERTRPCATAEFVRHFATTGNPYRPFLKGWDRQARAQFLNPDTLFQLFVEARNFVQECSPANKAALRRRWGEELYDLVTSQASEVKGVTDLPETSAAFVGIQKRFERVPNAKPIPDALTGGNLGHELMSSLFYRMLGLRAPNAGGTALKAP